MLYEFSKRGYLKAANILICCQLIQVLLTGKNEDIHKMLIHVELEWWKKCISQVDHFLQGTLKSPVPYEKTYPLASPT